MQRLIAFGWVIFRTTDEERNKTKRQKQETNESLNVTANAPSHKQILTY